MKKKFITVFSTTALIALAMFSVAQAQETTMPSAREGGDVEHGAPGEPMLISAQEQDSNDGEVRTKEQEHDKNKEQERKHATSTNSDEENDQATSSEDIEDNELSGEEHKNDVENFVESLLKVAEHEKEIGEKVREVAHEQDDLASTTAKVIEEVNSRSKVATFFFGSDYKNLGQLRSELVTTENNIQELKTLSSKASSATDKAELENQAKALEEAKAKVDAFITEHENTFSLFGWVVKMFAK